MNRRQFVGSIAVAALATQRILVGAAKPPVELSARVRGLLLGSFLGDALGGPVEFQDPVAVARLPHPPHRWSDDEELDAANVAAATARLRLRDYAPIRTAPEPFAHWRENAPAGTVTDDSRHKLVLLAALRQAYELDTWPLDVATLAQAYLDWPKSAALRGDPVRSELCEAWLQEWTYAARWVLGERDLARARPPERLWGGVPTCCGQMTLLPLAVLHAGDPDGAYRHAYAVGFFDNGCGKDLNAAIVAGLAAALTLSPDGRRSRATWPSVVAAMRATDPFGYGRVPWVKRSVDRWLDFVEETIVREGRPARVGAALAEVFRDTLKWEAQVPFVVAATALGMFPHDPLAALQWSIEWGHDTDSYAQLVGAFVGAMHGIEVLPAGMVSQVLGRVRADYGVDLEAEAAWLEFVGTTGTA